MNTNRRAGGRMGTDVLELNRRRRLLALSIAGVMLAVALGIAVTWTVFELEVRRKRERCRQNVEEIAKATFHYLRDHEYHPYDAKDPGGRKAFETLVAQGNLDRSCLHCPCDEGNDI